MPTVTLTDGLTLKVPTKGTTNWADSFLNDFAKKISAHDHTGSGKGNNIVTAAIANNAVTTAKIADNAVTTAKIVDGSVTPEKLQGGAIGAVPTGTIVMTLKGTADAGWVFLQSQVVAKVGAYAGLYAIFGDNYNTGGEGSGNFRLPNFFRRIPIGYDGIGFNLGDRTGSWDHVHSTSNHTHDLSNHVHSMNNHVHGMQSHTHDLSNHTHGMKNHTHVGASHTHGMPHTHFIGPHYHDTRSGGATIAIADSGAHIHVVPTKEGGANGSLAGRAQQASLASGNNDNNSVVTLSTGGAIGTHTHPNSTFSGSVGKRDTGFDGDLGAESGGPSNANTASGGASSTSGPSDNTTDVPSTNVTGAPSVVNTTGPSSSDTGTPSVNATGAGGAGSTGTANPPVIFVNYMCKM